MRLIRKNDIIKHHKFMDVCIKVDKVYDYGHGVEISGHWWNIGQVEAFPLGIKRRFNIGKSQDDVSFGSNRRSCLQDWTVLSPECVNDSCFRNSEWLKLG